MKIDNIDKNLLVIRNLKQIIDTFVFCEPDKKKERLETIVTDLITECLRIGEIR